LFEKAQKEERRNTSESNQQSVLSGSFGTQVDIPTGWIRLRTGSEGNK
jgi:hypothetical protein